MVVVSLYDVGEQDSIGTFRCGVDEDATRKQGSPRRDYGNAEFAQAPQHGHFTNLLPLILVYSYLYIHMHTRTHTNTHIYTHAHAHAP